MRILTLSYEFPPLGGGGSKVAHGLSAELVRGGHDVDIVTMGFRGVPKEETIDGARVHRVRCLRRALDVSHAHELASYMPGALSTASRLCRQNRYDLMHCHFIMPDGIVALRLRQRFGLPLVVTAHGSDVPGYNPDRFINMHRIISPAWRAIVRSIDTIVCPSKYLEDLLLKAEPRANTLTIPNGFDLDRFRADRPKRNSILILTRMLERKGVQDVLHAIAGTDVDYELNIVGTGPFLDELVALDRKLDTNANFLGWLDNDSDELRQLIEESAIFAFPSHAENFPLVLLEAMAGGAAIITTDQTGCKEVVDSAAIRVPAADPQALRRAIESLARDPQRRRQLGREARRRVEEHFGWPTVAARYLSTYRDAIATGT
ncbi:MAG: glycosyltransferase family 4 protein [Proteobacteria bacterium]|nr:glycosyltransferase family 4 protein [Pseudomonadota bacterium]